MSNASKQNGLYLLQRDPARDALLLKMREKLAGVASPVASDVSIKRKEIQAKKVFAWGWKTTLAALLVATNILLVGQKDRVMAKLGYQGVPPLPQPRTALTIDDQALYWTYALYDFQKLKTRFRVNGHYAVNPAEARKRLQDLLPKVSLTTLGTISQYGPVAFRNTLEGTRP